MSSETAQKHYQASLSPKFVFSSITGCCVLAFGMGKMARMHLVPQIVIPETSGRNSQIDMPTPMALEGKEIPETIYTAKNFDTRKSATSFSQWLQKDPNAPESSVPEPINERLSNLTDGAEHEEEEEEEHLPAGQHLLVDIDNIEADFLDSEERLATAMVELVNNSGLTLLSYHCHGLTPAGVSCAGVLLESHVSFHTWPAEGVITLDLFTCGATSLLNSMKLIEERFAIPRNGPDGDQPTVLWAYKRRGFKDQISDLPHNQPGSPRDTFAYPLGIHGLEFKEEIASAELAPGKNAYVYDLIQGPYQTTESYFKSLSQDGSYESNNPELFRPNRLFYYNGVLKSSRLGLTAAFESFVHPAMLSHSDPKKVAVFGVGAGAAIREVLKHKDVKEVVVVGVDEALLEFAKQHLQDWNDCSDITSHKSCFDDSRVKMADTLDAAQKFDIALVDMEYYNNMDIDQISSILKEEGIAAFHFSNDRPADLAHALPNGSRASNHRDGRNELISSLASVGFVETKEYEEKQVGFPEPRNYVVAFKSSAAVNWSRNEAQVNREIWRRTTSIGGSSSLQFIDGAKMSTYCKNIRQRSLDCKGSSAPFVCASPYQQNQENATDETNTCSGTSGEMPACNFASHLSSYPWKDTMVLS